MVSASARSAAKRALRFTKSMFWAGFFLELLLFCPVLLIFFDPTETAAKKAVLAITSFAHPIALLYLIHFMRLSPPAEPDSFPLPELPVWGYFWRGLMLFLWQVPILFIVQTILPVDFVVTEEAATLSTWQLLAMEFIFIPSSLLGAWIFLSRDRAGQMRKMIETIRGY